jgi:hypothetical protein
VGVEQEFPEPLVILLKRSVRPGPGQVGAKLRSASCSPSSSILRMKASCAADSGACATPRTPKIGRACPVHRGSPTLSYSRPRNTW